VYRPEILEESRAADAVTLRMHIAPELAYFAGHFEGWAILPGIVQVHWAIEWGQRYLGCNGVFQGIDNLKFLRLVRPGLDLVLELRFDAVKQRLEFVYEGGGIRYSSGFVRFAA
jgi:3-hydroxyacyl-[acyl-carrier-protein] dehydratase